MSVLVNNDCGVQTILPLGVDCSVVDATSPVSLDGTIYLNITGGSSPYSVTWSNGSNAQNLYSVSAGTYTATVVDFYGDYTATTTCTVGTKQFYVDFFVDCANEYNLYLTGFTDTVEESKVYKFNENTGCWIYSGKTLNGINILTSDTITEGPFDTCDECDPPIIPPYYPGTLCLSTNRPYTQYEFDFFGFINNKPAYTGTSSNALDYTIEWTTGGTIDQWQVKNKPGNTLTNSYDTYNPLGAWVLNGTTQDWVAFSGSCPPIQPLIGTVATSDPNCENTCNGSSAVVTPSGGVPPYLYSFDGGPFSTLPSSVNLCPGNHTYTITDSNGSDFTGSFVINKGKKVTTYTVSMTTKEVDTTTNYGTAVNSKYEYQIVVTPPLPLGTEITVPLNLSVKRLTSRPGATTVSYTPSLSSGSTTISPNSNSLISTSIIMPNFINTYYPYPYTAFTHNVNYSNLVLKNGVTISGTIDTFITFVNNGNPRFCNCKTFIVENTEKTTKKYHWSNCTGGTEYNYPIEAGEKVKFCACNAAPNSTPATFDGNGVIVTEDISNSNNCGNTITDGKVTVSASFGALTINESCTSIVALNPTTNLRRGLYQFDTGPLRGAQ